MSIKRLRQQGDTIVEVLICMAIVGFSLSSSYSLSRLSLRKVRDAEERGQSSQLVQMQLERLKAFLAKYPAITTTSSANWIMNVTSPGVTVTTTAPFSPPAIGGFCLYKSIAAIHYIFTTTDPKCAVNALGAYYCDDAAASPTLTDCSAAFPIVSGPIDDGKVVDELGYTYRAGVAYTPRSATFLNPAPLRDDEFYVTAGRYQVGGDGANSFKFSVVAIAYRIHQ